MIRRLTYVQYSDARALHDGLIDEHRVERRQLDLARLPRERDPERTQPEVARDGHGRDGRPFQPVVSGADEHAGLGTCCSRNEQHSRQSNDPDPTPHSPTAA